MALCVIPGEYGIYQTAGSVHWSTLLALWQFRFQPIHDLWTDDMLNQEIHTRMVELKFMLGQDPYFDASSHDIRTGFRC